MCLVEIVRAEVSPLVLNISRREILRRSRALIGPLSRSASIAGDTFTAAYPVGRSRFLGCEERLEAPLRDSVGRLAQRPA